MAGSVVLPAEAGIHICLISDRDYAGIELLLIAFLFAKKRAVFVMNIADEFKSAVWRIAYCYRDDAVVVQSIEEIVSAVRTYRNVRSIEASSVVSVGRIIRPLEDDAFVSPVAKIVNRC